MNVFRPIFHHEVHGKEQDGDRIRFLQSSIKFTGNLWNPIELVVKNQTGSYFYISCLICSQICLFFSFLTLILIDRYYVPVLFDI